MIYISTIFEEIFSSPLPYCNFLILGSTIPFFQLFISWCLPYDFGSFEDQHRLIMDKIGALDASNLNSTMPFTISSLEVVGITTAAGVVAVFHKFSIISK